MSEQWDRWNQSGGPKYPHEKVIQFCFRNYPALNDRIAVQALDLGCGSGVHTVFLRSEGFAVTATDVSPVAVENTRKRLADWGLKIDSLRCESADVLDFRASSFDLVICMGVLDAAGSQVTRGAIGRLQETLAPGGKGLFVFASDQDWRITGPNPLGLHGYTRSEVEELFVGKFPTVWIDKYVTTYRNGAEQQDDWLITIGN